MNETALPEATTAEASTHTETEAGKAAIAQANDQAQNTEAKEAAKAEKTPEQREIARLNRRIDSYAKRYHLTNAELERLRGEQVHSPRAQNVDTTQSTHAETETLQLSRKELDALIEQQARKLAPTIKQQEDVIERRRAVVTQLAKDLGKERFDALASDLDDAFGGLADDKGRAKPAADAIFEADDPKSLIEYLADPDHADEAEALSRMGELQAGRSIAKLEAKLEAKKAEAKSQASKVPAPLEAVRGDGAIKNKRLADLSGDDFAKRRKEQIKRRR